MKVKLKLTVDDYGTATLWDRPYSEDDSIMLFISNDGLLNLEEGKWVKDEDGDYYYRPAFEFCIDEDVDKPNNSPTLDKPSRFAVADIVPRSTGQTLRRINGEEVLLTDQEYVVYPDKNGTPPNCGLMQSRLMKLAGTTGLRTGFCCSEEE